VIEVVHRFGDSRGRGRIVVWRIVVIDGREVRRTLADYLTGELLDEVWRDRNGVTRSWTKGRTDPSAAGDRAASRAAVDRSPEAGDTCRIAARRTRPRSPARSMRALATGARPLSNDQRSSP
jgi:hypothetical protein